TQGGLRAPRKGGGRLSEEGRQGEPPQGVRRDGRAAARPAGGDAARRRADARLPALPSGRARLGGWGPQRKRSQQRAGRRRKARAPSRLEGVPDAGGPAAQGSGSRSQEDLVPLRRRVEEGSLAPRARDASQ